MSVMGRLGWYLRRRLVGDYVRRQRLEGARLVAFLACLGCNSSTSAGCGEPRLPVDQSARISIAQGLGGNAWEWVGNFQPAPQGVSCATVSPVSRTILIFPLLPASVFPGLAISTFLVDSIPAVPIDSTRSDSSGFFQVSLPAGSYSLITREGSKYYVRVPTTDYAYIGRSDVAAGQVTRLIVQINYRASF